MKTTAHTVYKLSTGERVPSVTGILGVLNKPALVLWANKLGLQGIDSTKYRDETAEIGTLGHYMILCHIKGEKPDLADYTANQIARAQTCFLKYLDWEETHKVVPVIVETPMVHETLKFGGTADFIGDVDEVPTLVDFKTGTGIYEEMFYQLGGYKLLLEANGHYPEVFKILRIGRDDSEGFEERTLIDLDLQTEVFLRCLDIYNLKKRIKG